MISRRKLPGMALTAPLEVLCCLSCQVRLSSDRQTNLILWLYAESISPSVMIPDHRLAVLLDQVKQNQISQCLYHNPTTSPSLFSDHICDRSQFPLQTVLELSNNEDQVWFLEFSHDGKRLATCGKDTAVVIYNMTTFRIDQILTEHNDSVAYVAWSPDDTKLITCSLDHKAKVWDTTVCTALS